MQRRWRAEAREQAARLAAETSRDEFLDEWLADSRRHKAAFEAHTRLMNAEQRASLAMREGFRTWHQMNACLEHMHGALEMFVHEDAFKEFWGRLKAADEREGFPSSYGPHNGAVPAHLLRLVEHWHKAPKFSQAERIQHGKKIAKACDELMLLIGQVLPGGLDEHQLNGFRLSERQVQSLLSAFEASKRSAKHFTEHFGPRRASDALAHAGVTPTSALGHLRESAMHWARSPASLPRKVRSAGTMKTHFIRELDRILCFPWVLVDGSKLVGHQLRADIVALLTGLDCSADDVRKATAADRAEREKERAVQLRRLAEDSGS